MSFASKTKKWKSEWNQVAFSDEKIFQTFSNGKVLVKRNRCKSEDPRFINFAIQQRKLSVNVWCCLIYGLKPLIYLAGENFQSSDYIKILNDVIKSRIPDFKSNYIFQQDNASIHVSNETKSYFREESLSVLVWPPCSPDLNIVEQIWSILQKKLDKITIKTKIKDQDHLFSIISGLADTITISQVNTLFDSVPNRIKCVLKSNGGFTRY